MRQCDVSNSFVKNMGKMKIILKADKPLNVHCPVIECWDGIEVRDGGERLIYCLRTFGSF